MLHRKDYKKLKDYVKAHKLQGRDAAQVNVKFKYDDDVRYVKPSLYH